MPAPKAVLRDIHDLGLNPKVAHKSVDSNGRIKPPAKAVEVLPAVEPIADKAPEASKAPAVTKVTKASDEVLPEVAVSSEGAGIVEHQQEEVTASEAPAVKPVAKPKPKRADS